MVNFVFLHLRLGTIAPLYVVLIEIFRIGTLLLLLIASYVKSVPVKYVVTVTVEVLHAVVVLYVYVVAGAVSVFAVVVGVVIGVGVRVRISDFAGVATDYASGRISYVIYVVIVTKGIFPKIFGGFGTTN